ncbi:MAG TPA: hypothetical protein PK264_07995 [Hyphomicrobiaceae bacterium]|nr:hypothetical protein [Hyphomicrobiaceae bacterium]
MKIRHAIGIALLSVPFLAASASAQGMSDLHTQVRIGNRICMADHFHTGSGNGASKDAAMRAAISSWSDFTAWEYGNNWGSWRLAETKSSTCEPGFGGGFSCTVHARPCRPR